MRIEIKVTVSSDDDKVYRSSENGIAIDSSIYSASDDKQRERNDFMEQASNLMRVICDNHVPALYDAVTAAGTEAAIQAAKKKSKKSEQPAEQEVK